MLGMILIIRTPVYLRQVSAFQHTEPWLAQSALSLTNGDDARKCNVRIEISLHRALCARKNLCLKLGFFLWLAKVVPGRECQTAHPHLPITTRTQKALSQMKRKTCTGQIPATVHNVNAERLIDDRSWMAPNI